MTGLVVAVSVRVTTPEWLLVAGEMPSVVVSATVATSATIVQ